MSLKLDSHTDLARRPRYRRLVRRFPPRARRPVAIVVLALGAGILALAAISEPSGRARGKPLLVLAVSAPDAARLFVLGDGRCRATGCAILFRSSDAGRKYTPAGAPPDWHDNGTLPTLVFANARDGYALIGDRLYTTHDGALRWSWVERGDSVDGVFVAAGRAYTEVCLRRNAGSCRVLSSPVAEDRFAGLRLPPMPRTASRQTDSLDDIESSGDTVLALLEPGSGSPGLLAASNDRGRTFREMTDPSCLGGTVAPAGSRVVWMKCITGLESGISRSIDRGRSASSTRASDLSNAALLAGVSGATAIVDCCGGSERLELLTDGGRRIRPVGPPHDANLGWLWLHFVDDRNGFALRIGSYETTPSQLWRTRDGGVRWSLVPLPNVPIR